MSCNPLRSWWAVFLCPLCFHYGLCVTVFFCFSFCGLIETKEKRQILTKDLFVSWYRYSCLLPPHFFFSKSFFFFLLHNLYNLCILFSICVSKTRARIILLWNQITGGNLNIWANFYLQSVDHFVIPEANSSRTTCIKIIKD